MDNKVVSDGLHLLWPIKMWKLWKRILQSAFLEVIILWLIYWYYISGLEPVRKTMGNKSKTGKDTNPNTNPKFKISNFWMLSVGSQIPLCRIFKLNMQHKS